MVVARGSAVVDVLAALAMAIAVSVWAAAVQAPTTSVTWDAVQYYLVTSQIATGQVPAAEAPYVYRLGLPWLVAQVWPADPARGFFLINVACGIVAAPLLAWWLRLGIARPLVRMLVVALFVVAWHGPIRYVHFNGGYVDPPFLIAVIAGLALLQAMREKPAAWHLAALTALTAAGTFLRETMILVPIAGLALGAGGGSPTAVGWFRSVRWSMAVPIAVAVAVIVYTRAVVDADTTRSFAAAFMQWIRKPPTAYALAWFTAFGPVLACVLFDWRAVLRDLRERPELAAFLVLCAGLAFPGGSDTERFLFWAMPVIYLLIGRAIERQWPWLTSAALAGGLIAAQAVSARVFWTIPDPRLEAAPLAADAGWIDRLYAIADRVFVIEHFHFNLWSSFGSRPFRMVRLALYVAVTGVLLYAMRRRARMAVA